MALVGRAEYEVTGFPVETGHLIVGLLAVVSVVQCDVIFRR